MGTIMENYIAKKKQGDSGMGMSQLLNLFGPVGNVVKQSFDGKQGIDLGETGKVTLANIMAGLGIATQNPSMIMGGAGASLRA